MHWLRRHLRGIPLLVAVSGGLTLILYARALALPFYSDDLLQVLWVKATPLMGMWRTLGPYGDYRPLPFTIWRVIFLLTGSLRPGVLHALNLISHATCGVLVGLLVARWKERPAFAAPLAAALFVSFPFAFDVVPWAVSFSYPLSLALALGALLLYLKARETGSLVGYALGLAFAALAPTAYEPAVIVAFAILLAEATLTRRHNYRWAGAYVAASALSLILIVLVPPARAEPLFVSPSLDTAAIALQAWLFPIAPLATLLGRTGIGAALSMCIVGVAALIAIGVVAVRRDLQREFLFGLGWAVLWSAIPLLTQQFNWLRDPPRVLYTSAVGAAILWSLALRTLLARRPGRLRVPASLALTAVALVPALVFLTRTVSVYKQAGDLLWQAISVSDGARTVLLVNLPGRITLPGRFYPLGHEGAIPMPPPSDADLLVQANAGRSGAAVQRSAGVIMPQLSYSVELAGPALQPSDMRNAGRVLVVDYSPTGFELQYVGEVFPAQNPAAPIAQFGDAVLLLDASCRRITSDRVTLSLRWQMTGTVQGTPTVFAHLLGSDGAPIAQADGDPIRGLYPLIAWVQGEVVDEVRVFEGVSDEPAYVIFGVWEPATGERLRATDALGEPLPDDAYRCEVAGQ